MILKKIDFVCAREQEDAERFNQAGISKEQIKITGNLKYDWFPWQNFPLEKGWLLPVEKMGYPIFTAGSIRQGEEKPLLDAYLKVKNKYPSLKLILAPRHLGWLFSIEKLLQANNLSFCLKSRLTLHSPFSTLDCILWDTFGDLWQAYQISTFVFVGGSLVGKGGQNPIEPAWFGKPVFFGPSMENFMEPARWLKEAQGALQVQDANELALKMDELLSNPEKLMRTAGRAKEIVEKLRGQATEKTMEILSAYVRA